MKVNYFALFVFLTIIGAIIYIVYDVNHRGYNEDGELWFTPLNSILVMYILLVIIGSVGINFTVTHAKQLLQDRKNLSFFHTAEAVLIYPYIYEYYVNGERYECREDRPFWKKPEKEKITVRYNPDKPEEVIQANYNKMFLVVGIICIGLTLLLIYGCIIIIKEI